MEAWTPDDQLPHPGGSNKRRFPFWYCNTGPTTAAAAATACFARSGQVSSSTFKWRSLFSSKQNQRQRLDCVRWAIIVGCCCSCAELPWILVHWRTVTKEIALSFSHIASTGCMSVVAFVSQTVGCPTIPFIASTSFVASSFFPPLPLSSLLPVSEWTSVSLNGDYPSRESCKTTSTRTSLSLDRLLAETEDFFLARSSLIQFLRSSFFLLSPSSPPRWSESFQSITILNGEKVSVLVNSQFIRLARFIYRLLNCFSTFQYFIHALFFYTTLVILSELISGISATWNLSL